MDFLNHHEIDDDEVILKSSVPPEVQMANPVKAGTSAATTEIPSAGSKIKSSETKRRRRLSDDGWGGFGGYMNAKKQKRDEQFNKQKTAWNSNIFAGVAVYVNGYTNPSSDELQRILRQNGGRFEMYLSKTRVTHIVATNLPNSKYHLTKTTPAVRPEWITDSVAAGKRLSHIPYLLVGNKSKLQPGLKTTFPPRMDETYEDSKFKACFPGCSLPKDEMKNVGQDDSKADNISSDKLLRTENTGFKDANDTWTCKPLLDTSGNDKIDVNTSHADKIHTVDDNVNVKVEKVDDDDEDIVFNSEEEDSDQQNRTKSKTLLFQGVSSPYKKSRVYNLRKFRKSNSGSFEVSGLGGTNSCDGFIEPSKMDLIDCDEGLHQKVKSPTPIGNLKDVGQACDYLPLTQDHSIDTISEHISDGKFKPVYSFERSTDVCKLNSNMSADKLLCLQVNPSALHSDGSSVVLASEYLSSETSKFEPVAPSSLNIHQSIINSASISHSIVSRPLQPEFSASASVYENEHSVMETRSLPQEREACSTSRPLLTPGVPLISKSEQKDLASKQTFQRTSSSMPKTGDKNFLSDFYSNSRLHHIATWGAELKAYVSGIQKSCNHVYPGREKLRQLHVENAMKIGQPEILSSARLDALKKVVMHIDMDCFFVSVGLLARPDLKGKPVAVTHSRGQGGKSNLDSNPEWERAEWMKKLNKKLKVTKSGTVENVDVDDTSETCESMNEDDTVPAESTGAQTFHSMAEIASCSYEARKAGVKNGMFMGTAVKLCPDLQTIPYNFAEYNRISRILYDAVASYTSDIEAVSCDEMLIDCTDVLSDTGATAMEFAQVLRAEMLEKTGCSASTGIGPNILLARLATRKAKPNGQFEVSAAEAKDFIKSQPVSYLPGVGYSISRKLAMLGVHVCGDLQDIPLSTLKQEFGPKTGETLHGFSLGLDSREIKGDKQRKSVSAEVNYGIRFAKDPEAVKFLQDLSLEVKRRLDAIGVKGRSITLKLMVRRSDAPVETAKFMGHGICNTFNKSSNLPLATNDEKVIAREVVSLYRAQRVVASDVRGIGIQINKLEKVETGRGVSSSHQALGHQTILSFAVPKTSSTITSTDSVDMTTVTTSSTIPANVTVINYRTVPISSLAPSSSSNGVGVSRESFTSLKNSRSEPVMSSETDNTEDTKKLKELCTGSSRAAQEVGSADDECNGQQNLNFPESDADNHKFKLIPAENKNLSICGNNFGRLAIVQDADVPTTSKSSIVKPAVNINRSWKFDLARPSTSREVEDVVDASFLTESQIDSNVLHELPSEIAQEILEDLRCRRQRKQLSSCTVPYPQVSCATIAPVHNSTSSESDKYVRGAAFHESLPSLSQLDLNCFSALPFHLQQELKAAYARENITTQRSLDKMAVLSDENAFTRLKSPSKSNRGKQSGAALKNLKQASKKGHSFGKRLLTFGSSKVKDGRHNNVAKKKASANSTKLASAYADVIICDDDDEDTNDSRGRCADDDSNSFQSVPGTTRLPSCSSDHAERLKLGTNVRKCQDKSAEEITFCGASSVDDVKKLMKEWLTCCPEPQDDDVAMVTEYLIKKIQQRNLEQVFCLLKFLIRRSLSQSSPQWKECVFNISTCIQNMTCAIYGATFKL